MIKFHILTLFPELFPGPLGTSVTGRALEKNLWGLQATNIRDFATDKHQTVDDVPFGGGAGMVLKPDVVERAALSAPPNARRIYLSPRGKVFNQHMAQDLARESDITFLCGRYEGVDQRVLDVCGFEEISIGDYVLTGGEMAAMIMMDAVVRLIPHVVGNDATTGEESFSNGLLEYPHYTRPAAWVDADGNTHSVPDILTSGHHGEVAKWRLLQAESLTKRMRPDLWAVYSQNTSKKT
jgi:tRNA (guanine37-N1)-methyltransferase